MQSEKIKVLLIDDEPRDFSTIFNSENWDLTVEKDGKRARQSLKSHSNNYDVILLDLDLENTNDFDKGLNLLLELNLCINFSIPIIVITKDFRDDSVKRALNNGAAEFIQKGQYDPSWVREEIVNVVQSFKIQYKYNNALDPFISSSRSFNSQKNNLIHALNSSNLSPIVSIIGAPGTGKQSMIKYIEQQGFKLQIFEMNELIDVANLTIVPKSIIVINNIESISLEKQAQLGSMLDTAKNKFIFLLSDKFHLQYSQHKVSDEIFNLISDGVKLELLPLHNRYEEISDLIHFFLLDPKMCPRHFPYFGKSAREVFSEECINRLKSYRWQSNIQELQYFIQYALCQVLLRRPYTKEKYPILITYDFFPARLSLESTNSFIKKPTQDTEDFRFLKALNEALNQCGNNIEQVVNQIGKSEEFIQKKLKEFYNKESISSRIADLPNAFSIYKINTLFCNSSESEPIYEKLIKNLNPFFVKNKIEVSHNYKLMTNNDPERSLATRLSEADIICLILCPDLLSSDVWECKIPREYAKTKKKPKQVVIPIVGKKLLKSSKFLELQALPTDYSPLSTNNRINEEKTVDVAEKIIESIEQLMLQLNKIPLHP